MSARLHSLKRSFADTTMVKLALFAALVALTTAAPARPQLRGQTLAADGPKPELPLLNNAQEAESIERRRLHDLWYYAPHANGGHSDSSSVNPVRLDGQEIEHSLHDRRLHDLWYYAPHPLSPKQEPKRRLHDLWYYAPHAKIGKGIEPSHERRLSPKIEPKRRLHDLWYYAPHADGKADSQPASPSKQAIESLNRRAPFGF
ncbi:unnamed protein product [Aphanomyces euteiches]|uniref:RxLR effector protein n=1 Tax=Aphanomyces euteiches TaxID=100861 RepID=A0A6G0XIM4_9STRA|nr:hypothetical protein Ae201684_004430 [Aphanomyces euteiches]KAH9094369.1 hypothetical protein Ae201684P_016978 [Aphanomyces euteiches]KAH9147440.1 hypothetical protein AeRB84_008961 [Aphanomyces euteiches]KAH9151220.1 hypothetical protein AeRB84_006117 [Aphanomyces euteiches]